MTNNEDTPSFEKVHYLLRLRKQIERKILIETLNQLPESEIQEYRYFGLGSIYYADFILFHKYLQINDMISVDNKKQYENRFKYNVPYKFVGFHLNEAFEIMNNGKLEWEDKNLLIWLDYDAPLSRSILKDIDLVAKKAKPKDILLVTIECDRYNEKTFINNYRKHFGIVAETEEASLKLLPYALRKIIIGCLTNAFTNKYDPQRLKFLQLFHITYKDTRKMYTFGCIFLPKKDINTFKGKVENLKFIRTDEDIVNINCPLLTPKEKIELDQCITSTGDIDARGTLVDLALNKEMKERYKEFYKYYPQYYESVY